MLRYIKVVVLILGIMCLTGCATVTTGPTQKVPVTSNPSGAIAKVDGDTMTGTTPTEFLLERKSDHIIEISKRGYKAVKVMLKRVVCGSTAGNLLIGGIIGIAVDASTGSIYKLVPEKVHVDLQRRGTSKVKSEDMHKISTMRPVKQRFDTQRRAIRQEPVIQQPAKQGLGADERLERLEDLYRKGLISEAKYNEEKAIILRTK